MTHEENKDSDYQATWGASPEKKAEVTEKLEPKEEDKKDEAKRPLTPRERANQSPAGDPNRPGSTSQGPSQ